MGRRRNRRDVAPGQIGGHRLGLVGIARAEFVEQSPEQFALAVDAPERRLHVEAGQGSEVVVPNLRARARGVRAACRQPAREHLEQGGFLDRLGQVVIHADCEEAFAIARHRMCGQRDDWRRLQVGIGLDQARRFDPVHLRHLHVHQHEVELLLDHALDRDAAVLGERYVESQAAEQFACHLAIDLVVLGDEDALATPEVHRRRARGILRVCAGPRAAVLLQGAHSGVEKGGRTGRLVQEYVDALPLGLGDELFVAEGGDHDRCRAACRPLQLAHDAEAVATGQAVVDQEQVETGRILAQDVEGPLTGLGQAHVEADRFEHAAEHVAGRRTVVDDQGARMVAQAACGGCRCGPGVRDCPEG